jgi:hypothetical protein
MLRRPSVRATPRQIRIPHLALILALGTGGCQGREIVAGVDDSTFVRTIAALRQVQGDSTIGDSVRRLRRDSVLRRNRVTADQLERAARALADDPPRAEALFQAVNRTTGTPDTARAPRGARRKRAL